MIIFDNTLYKKNFDDEIKTLNLILNKQLLLKKSVLKYMDKIANSALSSLYSTNQNIAYNYLSDIRKCLEMVDFSIDMVNQLLESCSNFKNSELVPSSSLITDYNKTFVANMDIIYQNDFNIQELMFKLVDYSKLDFSNVVVLDLLNDKLGSKEISQYTHLDENVNTSNVTDSIKPSLENKNFPLESLEKDFNPNKHLEFTVVDSNTSNISNNPKPSNVDSEAIKESTLEVDNFTLEENVLFISDIKKLVILPYTINELDRLIESGKYSSYREIINKKYTLPISYYNFASISRFRETYNLVKNHSNGSIKEAFDLGIELFFKHDLNPAIITSCRNIDELDIYLACLEDNDLDSFKCFKIVFEGLPTLAKKDKFL